MQKALGKPRVEMQTNKDREQETERVEWQTSAVDEVEEERALTEISPTETQETHHDVPKGNGHLMKLSKHSDTWQKKEKDFKGVSVLNRVKLNSLSVKSTIKTKGAQSIQTAIANPWNGQKSGGQSNNMRSEIDT